MTTTAAWYADQLRRYKALGDQGEDVRAYRCLDERGAVTPVDPWYFYQDAWAFRKVYKGRPAWHLDVGSTALLVGVLSQVVPVTSVDVRPLPVTLGGLTCLSGTVTALPFEDGTVPSASSLSVIEHIGLGRYGDDLDPRGSERACRELARVLAPGGRLYLSFPTGAAVTLFNAHRILPVEDVCGWLDGCDLVEGFIIEGGDTRVFCGEWAHD